MFWRSKFATKAWFTYISKQQSDFAISRGFYFHETSHMHMWSFAKIKPSRKFPNLQYSTESQLNKEFSFDTESQFQIKNCQYQMTISNT